MGSRDDTNKIVVYGHLKIGKGIARCMKAQTERREGLLVQDAERCSSEVYHRCCLQDPKCLARSKITDLEIIFPGQTHPDMEPLRSHLDSSFVTR